LRAARGCAQAADMVMVVAIFDKDVCLSNGDWTTRRSVLRRQIDRAINSPRAFRWSSLERSLSEVDFERMTWLGSDEKPQKEARFSVRERRFSDSGANWTNDFLHRSFSHAEPFQSVFC